MSLENSTSSDSDYLHEYYFIGTISTNIGSLIVIISYIFTPELRYHPSVLIFYRCIIDLALGMCLSAFWYIDRGYIGNDEKKYSNRDEICQWWLGPLQEFLFICNICYFIALITGLYTSIKNPFSSPNDINIKKINFLILVIGLSIAIAIGCTPILEYYYDNDVQLCLINVTSDDKTNQKHHETFLDGIYIYYAPLFITLIYGIFVTLMSFCRLRKGLPNTFNIRQKVIRDAWCYCLVFVIYIIINVIFYLFTRIPILHDNHIYHQNHY